MRFIRNYDSKFWLHENHLGSVLKIVTPRSYFIIIIQESGVYVLRLLFWPLNMLKKKLH